MHDGQANSHCSTSTTFNLTGELSAIGQGKGNDWKDERFCWLARRIIWRGAPAPYFGAWAQALASNFMIADPLMTLLN